MIFCVIGLLMVTACSTGGGGNNIVPVVTDMDVSQTDCEMAGLLLAKLAPAQAMKVKPACVVIQAAQDPQYIIDYINEKLADNAAYLNLNDQEAVIVRNWLVDKAGMLGLEIDPEQLLVLTDSGDVNLTDFKTKAAWICNGIQAGL